MCGESPSSYSSTKVPGVGGLPPSRVPFASRLLRGSFGDPYGQIPPAISLGGEAWDEHVRGFSRWGPLRGQREMPLCPSDPSADLLLMEFGLSTKKVQAN